MPRPHVLIDGYFLDKPYGFGRFSFELCRALGQARSEMAITVAVPDRVAEAALPAYPGVTWHRLPDANFIVWEQMRIPRLARQLSCDIIHFPYNTRALFTGRARTVTTVHDLLFLEQRSPVKHFKAFVAEQYSKIVFRVATPNSSTIVTGSVMTQGLLRSLGIASTVVYHTVDGFLELAGSTSSPASRPYLLHRGGYLPHRNTGRVIAAFRQARRDMPDIELQILGAPNGAEVWNTGDDPGIQFLSRRSDTELATLYAGAAGVVATSLVEGFGLPIIEGFGFGSPVITSNIDPMREVAGAAAILVDPFDVGAIAQAMTRVVNDTETAEALVDCGRKRSREFSSDIVAAKMFEVYRSCGRAP